MMKVKSMLRTVIKASVIAAVFTANSVLAQEKVEIPKWLSVEWYAPEAKFTDEWVFEVSNKGEIRFKAADEKADACKTGKITAIDETVKPVTYGKSMSGTISFSVDGKTYTVSYSDNSSSAYGLPAYLDISRITFKNARKDDPIFGKVAAKEYSFITTRGFHNIKIRKADQPEKMAKLPKAFVGKFYTRSKSAFCQKEEDKVFEVMADGGFSYKKGNDWVSGTIKHISYGKAGSLLKGNLAEAYEAIRIEVEGETYEIKYIEGDLSESGSYSNTEYSVMAFTSSKDKNVSIVNIGDRAGNAVLKAGQYYAVKETGACENFDERLIAMWYQDKPKAAQWGGDKLSPENKFWDFIIIEEKGKYYYCRPDMVESAKIGSRNRISSPSEGVLKMGKNEMSFQIEGNKLQVKGASGSGFVMGAQIKSGTYYKYSPDGPTVDDAEVAIEVAKQAAGLFK